MKNSDVNAVAAKLQGSQKLLFTTFATVEQQWNDVARRKFEEDYLATIEPNIKKMVEAITRLSTVLANAERHCNSEYQ